MLPRLAVLFLTGILVLFSGSASAEKQKVISDKNEYGGKTVEVTYESGDKLYGEAVKKIISYDGNGRKAIEEYFCADKYAQEKGINKKIASFDSSGKMTKAELLYTDKFADEKGVNRSIAYSDANGTETREELFHTDKFADEKGFHRDISYFDSNGKITKREFFYTDTFAGEKGYKSLLADV